MYVINLAWYVKYTSSRSHTSTKYSNAHDNLHVTSSSSSVKVYCRNFHAGHLFRMIRHGKPPHILSELDPCMRRAGPKNLLNWHQPKVWWAGPCCKLSAHTGLFYRNVNNSQCTCLFIPMHFAINMKLPYTVSENSKLHAFIFHSATFRYTS